jgi:hypothetical protein
MKAFTVTIQKDKEGYFEAIELYLDVHGEALGKELEFVGIQEITI